MAERRRQRIDQAIQERLEAAESRCKELEEALREASERFNKLADQAGEVRSRIVASGTDEAHKLAAEVETGRGVAYMFAADYLREIQALETKKKEER